MRPADRLFRIIQLMRATGRAMTAAEIAEKMEVAPRTIYRDMDHLIASGAPIEGERGVGYMLREAFDAPPLTFTFEQLEALAFGLRAVEMLGDPRLGQAAREAKEKMLGTICQAQGLDRLSLAAGRAQPAGRLAVGLGRLRCDLGDDRLVRDAPGVSRFPSRSRRGLEGDAGPFRSGTAPDLSGLSEAALLTDQKSVGTPPSAFRLATKASSSSSTAGSIGGRS